MRLSGIKLSFKVRSFSKRFKPLLRIDIGFFIIVDKQV